MRPFTGGLRNTNYLLSLVGNRSCALRIFALEDEDKQAEELLVLRHLAQEPAAAGLPVPRVLAAGRCATTDRPFTLLSLLPGRNAGRGLPGLAPSARERVAAELGGLMAQLHRVPPPRPGLGPWMHPATERPATDLRTYEAEAFARNLDRCLADGLLPDALAAGARRFVGRRADAFGRTEPPVLVHHDLHADNVLLTGLRISGIVDFEHARGRAAEYDWVMALWSLPPDGSDVGMERIGPLRRAFLDGYAAVRPLHPDWVTRFQCYQMIKAVGFLVYKPAYLDFLEQNRITITQLLALDGEGVG